MKRFREILSIPESFSATSFQLLLAGAGIRIICFFLSSNNGGDAVARAEDTAQWLQHMDWHLDAFGPYLPLHFWLMAIPSELTGNVLLGTRLLSLILGVFSLYLMWLAAYELFGPHSANYSVILFTFYSLHIGYSTTSSSEVPFLFFLLGALVLLFRYRRTQRLSYLALSGISLGCAAAIRYEAWVLILSCGLALLWPLTRLFRKGFWTAAELKPIATFTAVAGVWPITFMAYCWLKFRDPTHYFLTAQKIWIAAMGEFVKHSFLYILTLHPGVMLIALSPLGVAAIIYGIWTAREQGPPVRDYFIIMISFACVQVFDIASGGTWPSARFTLTLGTLLTIAGGLGIETLLSKMPVRRRAVTSSVFVAGMALNLGLILLLSEMNWRFSDKFRSVSPLVEFPMRIEQVSRYLKPRMTPESSIIIDNYNCESNIVARAVGMPLSGTKTFLALTRIPVQECDPLANFSTPAIVAREKDLYQFLDHQHPRYVLYSDEGALRQFLPLGDCSSSPKVLNGAEFRCVYSGSIYRVYDVTYPGLAATLGSPAQLRAPPL